jgi:hypothetical protein
MTVTTPSPSPFTPIVQHLANNKEMLPLPHYIDALKTDHDDWGIFVNPADPINDYKVGYVGFHYGNYQMVATLQELSEYPYNGETFCKLLPELIHANSDSF